MSRDIQDVMYAIGDADGDAYDDYSGRSMYGDECVAVDFESVKEGFVMFAKMAANEPELALELARTARLDNMGRGIVVYWPNLISRKATA